MLKHFTQMVTQSRVGTLLKTTGSYILTRGSAMLQCIK